MTFVNRHEGLLTKIMTFIFIMVLLFGSVYSPLYTLTAYGDSLINNRKDGSNSDTYYKIYPATENVNSEANGNSKSSGVDGIVEISTDDIPKADNIQPFITWFLKGETYYFLAEENNLICNNNDTNTGNNSNHIIPFFNLPNFQKDIHNMITDKTNSTGGYLGGNYINYVNEENEWTTASKKYGYIFPNRTYFGENPVITYDLEGTLSSVTNDPLDNIAFIGTIALNNTIGSVVRFFTGDDERVFTWDKVSNWKDVIGASSNGDLVYHNQDYENITKIDRVVLWFYKNYNNPEIKDLELLEIDGSNFGDLIYEEIENNKGKYNDVDSANIYQLIDEDINSGVYRFKEFFLTLCGTNITEINERYASEENAIKNGYPIGNIYLRYMPYNLYDMSQASQEAIGNYQDPRYEKFGTTNIVESKIGGMGTIIYGTVAGFIVMLTAALCSFASTLNSMCSFRFMDEAGFDFTLLWNSPIGKVLLVAFGIAVILYLVRIVYKVATGNIGFIQTLGKALTLVFALGLIGALLAAPTMTSNAIKDIFSKVMNIGSTLMVNSNTIDDYDQLYTTNASEDDKNDLQYWSVAYNCWSYYNTNHKGVGDPSAKFSIDRNDNTYIHLDRSPALLGNEKECNLWPVVLLEYEYKNSNGIYRVVDHYMAPKFAVENSNEGPILKASLNSNYNGNIQSTLMPQYIFIALVILFVTGIKLLFFIELMIQLTLLIVKIMTSAFDGTSGIKDAVMKVLKPLGALTILDIIKGMVIFLALNPTSTGNTSDAEIMLTSVTIVLVALSVYYVNHMIKNSESFMTPIIISETLRHGKRVVGAAVGYGKEVAADIESGNNKTIIAKGKQKTNDFREKAKAKQTTDTNKKNKLEQNNTNDTKPDNKTEGDE